MANMDRSSICFFCYVFKFSDSLYQFSAVQFNFVSPARLSVFVFLSVFNPTPPPPPLLSISISVFVSLSLRQALPVCVQPHPPSVYQYFCLSPCLLDRPFLSVFNPTPLLSINISVFVSLSLRQALPVCVQPHPPSVCQYFCLSPCLLDRPFLSMFTPTPLLSVSISVCLPVS